jgi:predicted ArsR family transcriptional regulator
MVDVLALPETPRQLVHWFLRHDRVTLTEVAAHLGQDHALARATLDTLVAEGFVQLQDYAGTPRYRLCLVARPPRQATTRFWATLGQKLDC